MGTQSSTLRPPPDPARTQVVDPKGFLTTDGFWFLYQLFRAAQASEGTAVLEAFDSVSEQALPIATDTQITSTLEPAAASVIQDDIDQIKKQESSGDQQPSLAGTFSALKGYFQDLATLGSGIQDPALAGTFSSIKGYFQDLAVLLFMANESGGKKTPTILIGTHAQRLALYPAAAQEPGTLFYETDRTSFYIVNASHVWIWAAGVMVDVTANRPSDLNITSDIGFLFYDTSKNVLQRGINKGSIYFAYLLGNDSGTLSNLPVGLQAEDVGYIYFAQDYLHAYRWAGLNWEFAQGDAGSGYIVAATNLPIGGLWQLCNGSTALCATSLGGTASITTPDLTGDIVVMGGNYTGNRDAATRATWETTAVTDNESSHTHSVPIPALNVNIPGQTTSNESADTTVQSGAGASVAASPHVHSESAFSVSSDPSSTTSGAGSAHHHALSNANAQLKVFSEANGGMPLRMKLQWYIRR